jgi:hypothetical protein
MITTRHFILLITLAAELSATAVCLDPKTGVSGYRIPFKEEISSINYIAIGKITKKGSIQNSEVDREDTDPYIIYTIEITRQLKNNLPKVISIKVELNSGRYVMDVGEEHLLFLTKKKDYFFVNSCGNSSSLPRGNSALKQVEEQLKPESNAP